jgi:hypothetical protein
VAVTKSNSLASSKPKVSVYVNIEYKGAQYHALLDSGCDVSVLGAKSLPGLSYQPTDQKLFAANSSPVTIVGSAHVTFGISGQQFQCDFLIATPWTKLCWVPTGSPKIDVFGTSMNPSCGSKQSSWLDVCVCRQSPEGIACVAST